MGGNERRKNTEWEKGECRVENEGWRVRRRNGGWKRRDEGRKEG